MCSRNLWLFLGLLLVAVQSALGGSIRENIIQKEKISFFAPNSSVVFRSGKLIRINGTRFSELNCTYHDSLAKKSCSNITEVTCQERLGQIESCAVSNKDSIFFNSQVVNRTIVCNRWRQISGNCYLLFSPDFKTSLQSASHPKKNDESVSSAFATTSFTKTSKKPFYKANPIDLKDQMDERWKKDDEKFANFTKIAFIVFGIFIVVCFGCPLLICCAVFINNTFLGGRYNIPCEDCCQGGGAGSSVNVGTAGTDYR